jgi:hypothetical protein
MRPAVELQILPGDEPGLSAAEEGAGGAELLGMAEAPRRDRRDDARACLLDRDAERLDHLRGHDALAVGAEALRRQVCRS